MNVLSILGFVVVLSHIVLSNDLILKPSGDKVGTITGIIFLQGAYIPADSYQDILKSVQDDYPFPLFIGVPDGPNSTTDPANAGTLINEMQQKLNAAGLPSDAPMFYGGHSLGGTTIVTWAYQNFDNDKYNVKALFLWGAYITRSERHYNQTHDTGDNTFGFPVPVLTLGGELDGLTRITRIAEEFYVQIVRPSQKSASEKKHKFSRKEDSFDPYYVTNFPVIVFDGVSHIQFCNGPVTERIGELDLKPEVSLEFAHIEIADTTAAYVALQMNINSNTNFNKINSLVNNSTYLLNPIIEALLFEGSYWFQKPCYCHDIVCPRGNEYCQAGSQWTMHVSQPMMCDMMDDYLLFLNTSDSYHRVYTVMVEPPYVHEPHIFGNCTSNEECQLNIWSITQLVYQNAEGEYQEDNALGAVGAVEMRTKLISRQSCQYRRGNGMQDFNKTDGVNNCAQINQYSIDYAIGLISSQPTNTLSRYNAIGVPMVVGDDIPEYEGPDWIWNLMNYTLVFDSKGVPSLKVRSQSLPTPLDQFAGGYHYCKVVSPAFMMDWLYTDSLRYRDTITNSSYLYTFLNYPVSK